MKKIVSKGFTLIELAVALTIVALVIGGLAVPMSKRIAEQQYIDTQANIDKAIESLVGFAILNRRLPCPDVSTAAPDNRDGFEKTAVTGALVTGCASGLAAATAVTANFHSDANGVSWGDLPWQTLGLAPPANVDAWNKRLRYAVFTPLVTQGLPAVPAFCNNTGTTADIGFANLNCLTNPGAAGPAITAGVLNAQIDVRCTDPVAKTATPASAPLGCTPTTPPTITPPTYAVSQNIVFVVYSMGANGLGATSILGTATTPFTLTAANVDQAVNATELKVPTAPATAAEGVRLRRQFVARARTDASSNAGEFDDVVSFMSSASLAARLANAGVWP
jgi:prepilin-type N-terminal cleavage/methylation domain-containing protein